MAEQSDLTPPAATGAMNETQSVPGSATGEAQATPPAAEVDDSTARAVAAADGAAADGAATDEAPAKPPAPAKRGGSGDRAAPLRKLVELAAKYPEIGPPLAELAFAIGERTTGDQLVRLGTDRESPSVEYFFVAANSARREGRFDDVITAVGQALEQYAGGSETVVDGDDDRLLHLVRLGFATQMFDLKDLSAESAFARKVTQFLPTFEQRLGTNAFYRTLLAQTLWFGDKAASEQQWDQADLLGDDEATWNARGTWYREAEQDLDRAEQAYRRGLDKAKGSALLMHNVAQVLLEKAKRPGTQPGDAHRMLNQATEMLRHALRGDAPRLRRHVHATRDRLEEFRRTLPTTERRGGPPNRDRAGGPGRPGNGPRRDNRPPRDHNGPRGGGRDDRSARGDHRDRRPDRGAPQISGRTDDRAGDRSDVQGRSQPREPFLQKGTVSLGEMILAKLKEKS